MKVLVKTVNALTASELKKVRDIMRNSKSPNQELKVVFPNRYVGMEKTNKKQETVWLDNRVGIQHSYTVEA